eukprot:1843656-Amphidinium_carterae.1
MQLALASVVAGRGLATWAKRAVWNQCMNCDALRAHPPKSTICAGIMQPWTSVSATSESLQTKNSLHDNLSDAKARVDANFTCRPLPHRRLLCVVFLWALAADPHGASSN